MSILDRLGKATEEAFSHVLGRLKATDEKVETLSSGHEDLSQVVEDLKAKLTSAELRLAKVEAELSEEVAESAASGIEGLVSSAGGGASSPAVSAHDLEPSAEPNSAQAPAQPLPPAEEAPEPVTEEAPEVQAEPAAEVQKTSEPVVSQDKTTVYNPDTGVTTTLHHATGVTQGTADDGSSTAPEQAAVRQALNAAASAGVSIGQGG